MNQYRNLRTKYSKILKCDGLFSVSKVISKVYINNQKYRHLLVCVFCIRADLKNYMQMSGGHLLGAGWTAATP